jgi:FlaA1/EpsC-like NDP-sugar epimerase
VRIAEMARDLVRLSGLEPGRDIEIVYTGLRPGEKLAEELWTGTEDLEPTVQDKLLVIRRPAAETASLERLAKAGDVEHLIPALRRVVPEYEPIAVSAAGAAGCVVGAGRRGRRAGGRAGWPGCGRC